MFRSNRRAGSADAGGGGGGARLCFLFPILGGAELFPRDVTLVTLGSCAATATMDSESRGIAPGASAGRRCSPEATARRPTAAASVRGSSPSSSAAAAAAAAASSSSSSAGDPPAGVGSGSLGVSSDACARAPAGSEGDEREADLLALAPPRGRFSFFRRDASSSRESGDVLFRAHCGPSMESTSRIGFERSRLARPPGGTAAFSALSASSAARRAFSSGEASSEDVPRTSRMVNFFPSRADFSPASSSSAPREDFDLASSGVARSSGGSGASLTPTPLGTVIVSTSSPPFRLSCQGFVTVSWSICSSSGISVFAQVTSGRLLAPRLEGSNGFTSTRSQSSRTVSPACTCARRSGGGRRADGGVSAGRATSEEERGGEARATTPNAIRARGIAIDDDGRRLRTRESRGGNSRRMGCRSRTSTIKGSCGGVAACSLLEFEALRRPPPRSFRLETCARGGGGAAMVGKGLSTPSFEPSARRDCLHGIRRPAAGRLPRSKRARDRRPRSAANDPRSARRAARGEGGARRGDRAPRSRSAR